MGELSELREIPGWVGYYASSDGRIWSVWRRKPLFCGVGEGSLAGTVAVMREPREVQQFDRKLIDGKPSRYATVALSSERWHKGRRRRMNKYVHELVMLAFVGPRPSPDVEICHGDGNGRNNRLDNLRYDTVEANIDDRTRHARERERAELADRGFIVDDCDEVENAPPRTRYVSVFDDLLEGAA